MNIKDSVTYLANSGVTEIVVSERSWQQFREDLLDGNILIPVSKIQFLNPGIKELMYRGVKISLKKEVK
jgi:hypothetical protein